MQLQQTLDPHALAKALSGLHFIDGELRPARSGRTFDVIHPATGEVVAQAAFGDADDVAAAVASAKAAQAAWARRRARDRGALVAECGRRLATHAEELGRLVALETGKALRTESRVEAGVLADIFQFYGGLGSELKGETIPFNPDMLTMTLREPLGVVGAIIPWNVPMLLMALKVAPALVAGNTVVVKSAEEAPLACLRAVQIMSEVLPKGVLNILSGFGPECGGPLTAHPDVRKVSFTGSVETGKIVAQVAAARLVPATLELGGKSPMIVAADADLPRAIEGAIVGMRFTRQGQSCTAASRMFVHEKVFDAFVEGVTARVNSMKMGDPLDEATDIGTIISPGQFERVKTYIELAKGAPGAKAYACSALPTEARFARGLFVQPHVFTGVPNDHRACREEIFGPVTCVMSWTDFDQVIDMANDSEYGLAATMWTRDLRMAMQATQRLQAGLVQVNQNLVVQSMLHYGGVKNSGLGKEASLEAMLDHFTHKKAVVINMT